MTNHVTPQTATRLKKSGFPQPVPAPGQVWYTENDTPFIISLVIPESGFVSTAWPETGEFGTNKISALLSCAYAPTATDILRELGNDYHIGILDGVFVAGLHQFGQSDLQFNENQAEACAMAWEGKQSKQ